MFDLARQLHRLGEDVSLCTALPRWKADPDLRPLVHTRSHRLLLWRAAGRLPVLRNTNRWENDTFRDFGRWLGGYASKAGLDVIDALDGIGLEAGAEVQRRGGIWICNRGSSHILTQRELLRAEHERWRQPMPHSYFDPWMVDRCLAEYRAATAIAVPSHFAKRSFVAHGIDESSVHVCPYGVDLAMFRPVPRADRRFRLLFVGAQSIQKGIGHLFDAVRPLVRSGHVELWLVGPTTSDGRAILNRNADLFVHHGVQPRSRLSWFYSQASVLVLPSVQEGLALVQAQAMACGVPVIATVNTGAEDLFTDGVEGFIVPPRDPEAIRERIQFLLDNPRRLEIMGAAALSRVQSLGGWGRYGERCRDLYRTLRAEPRPALSDALS
jgi:glycosyltransferase involved in cell wall biosynthesis